MKKVIITGCPRSGTTALAELLSKDSRTLITNEVSNFTFNEESSLENILCRKYAIDNFREILNSKGIYEEYYKDSIFFESHSYLQQLQTAYGLEIIGDKWPDYLFHINDIETLNNTAEDFYFIFTIRSCYHFINSSTTNYNNGKRDAWNFYDEKKAEGYWVSRNLELIKNVQYLQKKNIPVKIINYDTIKGNASNLVNHISNFINEELVIENSNESYYYSGKETKIKLGSEARIIMELFGYEINN